MEIESGKIALFDRGEDNRSLKRQLIDGPNHGPLGPNHFGNIFEPEFEYQLEELFREVSEDYPQVIRAQSADGRHWRRDNDGMFVRFEPNGR